MLNVPLGFTEYGMTNASNLGGDSPCQQPTKGAFIKGEKGSAFLME